MKAYTVEGNDNYIECNTLISVKEWDTLFGAFLTNYKSPFDQFQEFAYKCTNLKGSEKIFDDEEIHNIRMTWDGETVTTYIDNKEVKSDTSDSIIKGFKSIHNI